MLNIDFQGAQSERQDDSSSASSNADCDPTGGAAQEREGKGAAFACDGDDGGFDGVDDDGDGGDDEDEEHFDQRTMNCNEQFFPRNPGKVLIASQM